ncbi:MAG: PepSY domain-containing protein [Nanoarchaeota archaeon]|nr:PepSY domain-containing protein [Nanoarchaeota archaeon]
MEERTILKIALGFIIVFILASSSFLASALFSKENKATGMATATNALEAEKKAIDDEEEFDEDDLSQQELANLKTDITEEEAIQIALKRVNGEVTDVEIERKKGHEVYAVEIDDNGDEVDVFVDVKTGEIVGTERDSEEDEEDDD